MLLNVSVSGVFGGVQYSRGVQSVDDRIGGEMLANKFARPVKDLYGFESGGGDSEYLIKRKSISLLIHGQSNERGQVNISEKASFPDCFGSVRKPALTSPINGVLTNQGGFWFRVFDALHDAGYDAKIVNMARGSLSFIRDLSGFCEFRNSNSQYIKNRQSIGGGDLGRFGNLTVQNGKLFQCVQGRDQYCQYNGNFRIDGSNVSKLDYLLTVGNQLSAASAPSGWASVALGGELVDGGITWRCIDATNSVGYANGMVFSESNFGYGFDPFGLICDGHERMQAIQADEKIVYLQNGQSDLWATADWYRSALKNIANYYLNRGYKVLLGLSCYNPSSNNLAAYERLEDGLELALSDFAGNNNVFAGANLFRLMGYQDSMGSGGAYLQADNVHLNALGAIVASDLISNAILGAVA